LKSLSLARRVASVSSDFFSFPHNLYGNFFCHKMDLFVIMRLLFKHANYILAIGLLAGLLQPPVFAQQPVFLGQVEIEGTALDLSGKKQSFATGVPENQLGGFSAIAATDTPDEFLLLADRGPDDGAHDYETRLHRIRLGMQPKGVISQGPGSDSNKEWSYAFDVTLLETTMLVSGGKPLVGSSSVFAENEKYAGRFDPEGIRVLSNGDLLISDEYGPTLSIFSDGGVLQRRLAIPSAFEISNPGLTKGDENAANQFGRQGNGGFEGVAVSANGRYVTAILQGPLLQDGAFDESGEELGRFARIYRMDMATGESKQFAYRLESCNYGVSEILAIDDDNFLVLERDGEAADAAVCKAIYRISIAEASDISNVKSLGADKLSPAIQPVKKEMYLDMLDASYKLRSAIPKKIEGMCWGRTLSDGTRTLVICSDNDFQPQQSSQIYVFGIRD
jgi:hypothetical protein